MDQESTEPEIVDLATFRTARLLRIKAIDNEIVTEVHFAVTRGGKIVPTAPRVAELHVLAVLGWCLSLSSNMLDTYINLPH